MRDVQAESVSDALARIKTSLEHEFKNLVISGEVTNLSRSASGHIYFSLNDQDSSLSCALFRMDALRNPAASKMKNGDHLICYGNVGVYTKRGTFQLIIKRIEQAGQGKLQEQLAALKKRLAQEGLFDLAHKQKVPVYAKRIGLITAHGSAAYFDFINVLNRRTLWMDILLAPALVQGDKSAASLRSSLHQLIKYHLQADEEHKLDVIVLTRGGGALEDLWSFNDEAFAWDLHQCPIPVISAVGHDVDYSLTDYVADVRCETPTAAAEFLSQGQMEIKSTLEQARKNLHSFARSLLYKYQDELSQKSPYALLDMMKSKLQAYKDKVASLNPLERIHEMTGYHEHSMALEDCLNGLMRYQHRLELWKEKLDRHEQVLSALGPQNVLKRGYSFMRDEEGQVLTRVERFQNVAEGSSLKVYFYDGDGDVIKK